MQVRGAGAQKAYIGLYQVSGGREYYSQQQPARRFYGRPPIMRRSNKSIFCLRSHPTCAATPWSIKRNKTYFTTSDASETRGTCTSIGRPQQAPTQSLCLSKHLWEGPVTLGGAPASGEGGCRCGMINVSPVERTRVLDARFATSTGPGRAPGNRSGPEGVLRTSSRMPHRHRCGRWQSPPSQIGRCPTTNESGFFLESALTPIKPARGEEKKQSVISAAGVLMNTAPCPTRRMMQCSGTSRIRMQFIQRNANCMNSTPCASRC